MSKFSDNVNQYFHSAQKTLLNSADEFFRINRDYADEKALVAWELQSANARRQALHVRCDQKDSKNQQICEEKNSDILKKDLSKPSKVAKEAYELEQKFALEHEKAQ